MTDESAVTPVELPVTEPESALPPATEPPPPEPPTAEPPAEVPEPEPATAEAPADDAPPPRPVRDSQPVPVVPPAPQPYDLSRIAQDLQIRKIQVEAVVELLDAGNTVPFITRYRKEKTGGLDEVALRRVQERVDALRALADRKQTVLKVVAGQGALTPEFTEAVLTADHPKRLEDLYLPYKPKRKTLANDAREKGLEDLAVAVWTSDEAAANLAEIAGEMVNPDKGLATADAVLAGVGHILAEVIAERADVRGPARMFLWDTAVLASLKDEKLPEGKGREFQDYFDFKEPVRLIPPHRVLAINRGEKENAVRARLEFELPRLTEIVLANLPFADHAHKEFLLKVTDDAVTRLIVPSLEREIRRDLTDRAQERAVHIFAQNLRSLLLQPPLRGKKVLAIDPGLRTGCKIAALDETGALLEESVIFPHPPQKKTAAAARKLEQFVRKHGTSVIAIGNGTACRETEQLVSDLIAALAHRRANPTPAVSAAAPVTSETAAVVVEPVAAPAAVAEEAVVTTPVLDTPLGGSETSFVTPMVLPGEGDASLSTPVSAATDSVSAPAETVAPAAPAAPPPPPEPEIDLTGLPDAPEDLAYIIVNEAGASEYSASPVAREEFPNLDATARGTVSIGRRLQDPLAELVKIEPQHVGVGQYQHDVKAKALKDVLEKVVESCVNHVGVDLNTASAPLLRQVSGLNALVAREVVEYRKANGPFKAREQLKNVPNFGEKRFEQAAGFLKIADGEEPLDNTWVHPEQYAAARQFLSDLGFTPADLKAKPKEVREALLGKNPDEFAAKYGVGAPTMWDLFDAVAKPGRDPREELPPPVFRTGILKLEDLTAGMELKGTVLNVVDFGAFVDVGLKDSGLVHISQMANRYIKSPYDVVAVGDVVTVWVMGVDADRRRVSLTMLQPGGERRPPERERRPEPRPQQDRPPPRHQQQQPQHQDRPPQGGDQMDRPRAPRQVPARFQQRPPAPRQDGDGPRGPQPGSLPGPAVPRTPPRPKAPVKLTDEKKAGKAPLQTFAELAAMFNKPKPPEPPAETPPPDAPAP